MCVGSYMQEISKLNIDTCITFILKLYTIKNKSYFNMWAISFSLCSRPSVIFIFNYTKILCVDFNLRVFSGCSYFYFATYLTSLQHNNVLLAPGRLVVGKKSEIAGTLFPLHIYVYSFILEMLRASHEGFSISQGHTLFS